MNPRKFGKSEAAENKPISGESDSLEASPTAVASQLTNEMQQLADNANDSRLAGFRGAKLKNGLVSFIQKRFSPGNQNLINLTAL
ncbi:hypothetical protein RQN30_02540 [Arcanobacterium hippocoleae]